MRNQQNDLAQAEKMASLGTLTAGIAHEINNPLNFISGSLHALNTLKNELFKLEERITPEAKFVEDLGMDSMMALEILASIEKKYKLKIPEEYLGKVSDLANLIEITKKFLEEK